MKLTSINYNSAVFFGILSLVMYLPLGVFMWSLRDTLLAQGVSITATQTFVVTPITWGLVGYLGMIITIAVYNFVAKKYPISWEVTKK